MPIVHPFFIALPEAFFPGSFFSSFSLLKVIRIKVRKTFGKILLSPFTRH